MHIPKSLGGRHQLSSVFGSKQLKKRLAASLDDNLRGDNQLLCILSKKKEKLNVGIFFVLQLPAELILFFEDR